MTSTNNMSMNHISKDLSLENSEIFTWLEKIDIRTNQIHVGKHRWKGVDWCCFFQLRQDTGLVGLNFGYVGEPIIPSSCAESILLTVSILIFENTKSCPLEYREYHFQYPPEEHIKKPGLPWNAIKIDYFISKGMIVAYRKQSIVFAQVTIEPKRKNNFKNDQEQLDYIAEKLKLETQLDNPNNDKSSTSPTQKKLVLSKVYQDRVATKISDQSEIVINKPINLPLLPITPPQYFIDTTLDDHSLKPQSTEERSKVSNMIEIEDNKDENSVSEIYPLESKISIIDEENIIKVSHSRRTSMNSSCSEYTHTSSIHELEFNYDHDNNNNNNNDNDSVKIENISTKKAKKKKKRIKKNKGLDDSIYNEKSSNNGNQNIKKNVVIPESFLCSINLDIMKDPVMCTDGHSYERKAIEEWFLRSDRSPKTNEILISTQLFPNHSLRAAIQEFLEQSEKS